MGKHTSKSKAANALATLIPGRVYKATHVSALFYRIESVQRETGIVVISSFNPAPDAKRANIHGRPIRVDSLAAYNLQLLTPEDEPEQLLSKLGEYVRSHRRSAQERTVPLKFEENSAQGGTTSRRMRSLGITLPPALFDQVIDYAAEQQHALNGSATPIEVTTTEAIRMLVRLGLRAHGERKSASAKAAE